jgi:5-methylcytosine-specific restriction endonuclease McrA
MDLAVRELIRRRADNLCEYCRLKQEYLLFSTFQVEHIIPRKHGGDDNPTNLALACDRGNSHKGTNLTGVDPVTGHIVALFNPRLQVWDDHFRLSDVTTIGLTAVGRTTARVLNMNEEHRVRLRAVLKRYGQL